MNSYETKLQQIIDDLKQRLARSCRYLVEIERENVVLKRQLEEKDQRLIELDHCREVAGRVEDMERLLSELTAHVWGEAPQLLEEDRGGDGQLALKIEDAIYWRERAENAERHLKKWKPEPPDPYDASVGGLKKK